MIKSFFALISAVLSAFMGIEQSKNAKSVLDHERPLLPYLFTGIFLTIIFVGIMAGTVHLLLKVLWHHTNPVNASLTMIRKLANKTLLYIYSSF